MVLLKGLDLKSGLKGSLSVQFDFEPSVGIFAGRIDKLGMDIRSFRVPLQRAIKEVMIPSFRTNFETGGRPTWPALSNATWDTRTKLGWSGGGPLLLSGNLMKVATQQNIWTVTGQSASIRDLPQKAWYGKVHQAGAGGGRRTTTRRRAVRGRGGIIRYLGARDSDGGGRGYVSIPARPFILIQPEDREKVAEVFENWLGERMKVHLG